MKKTIKNNILNKIKTGEVKMRSRVNVIAEKVGIRSGVLLLFLGLIFLSGLVSYWFTLNSDLILGGYGKYGLRTFLQIFPYTLVVIFIVLFLLFSLILRRFDFSYKKPFIFILSVFIGLALILGWFFLNTPYGRGFYRNEGRFFRTGWIRNSANMVNGQVLEVKGNALIINAQDGKTVFVKISDNTHYPFGAPKVGDIIRLVGVWNGGNFEAVGIRVFDKDDVNGMTGRNGSGGGRMNGQGKNPGRTLFNLE